MTIWIIVLRFLLRRSADNCQVSQGLEGGGASRQAARVIKTGWRHGRVKSRTELLGVSSMAQFFLGAPYFFFFADASRAGMKAWVCCFFCCLLNVFSLLRMCCVRDYMAVREFSWDLRDVVAMDLYHMLLSQTLAFETREYRFQFSFFSLNLEKCKENTLIKTCTCNGYVVSICQQLSVISFNLWEMFYNFCLYLISVLFVDKTLTPYSHIQ